MYRDRVTYYRPCVRQMRPLFLGSSGFSCQEGWGRLVQPPFSGLIYSMFGLLEAWYWIKCDFGKCGSILLVIRLDIHFSPFLSIIELFVFICFTRIKNNLKIIGRGLLRFKSTYSLTRRLFFLFFYYKVV